MIGVGQAEMLGQPGVQLRVECRDSLGQAQTDDAANLRLIRRLQVKPIGGRQYRLDDARHRVGQRAIQSKTNSW